MATKEIDVLKSYFETGDKPTQQQFVNLIDSFLHVDDLPNQALVKADLGEAAQGVDESKYMTPETVKIAIERLTRLANIPDLALEVRSAINVKSLIERDISDTKYLMSQAKATLDDAGRGTDHAKYMTARTVRAAIEVLTRLASIPDLEREVTAAINQKATAERAISDTKYLSHFTHRWNVGNLALNTHISGVLSSKDLSLLTIGQGVDVDNGAGQWIIRGISDVGQQVIKLSVHQIKSETPVVTVDFNQVSGGKTFDQIWVEYSIDAANPHPIIIYLSVNSPTVPNDTDVTAHVEQVYGSQLIKTMGYIDNKLGRYIRKANLQFDGQIIINNPADYNTNPTVQVFNIRSSLRDIQSPPWSEDTSRNYEGNTITIRNEYEGFNIIDEVASYAEEDGAFDKFKLRAISI